MSATSSKSSAIQGLRALAVLSVVIFHTGRAVPGGFIGVDVFFVISGFVITRMLLNEWHNYGKIGLKKFYFRRIKRLGPALSIVVITTTIAAAYVLSPFGAQQLTTSTAISVLLLISNFAIANSTGDYFDSPSKANPLLNMWSLSIEEQFYLVFPTLLILLLLISRKVKSKNLALVAISFLAVSSYFTFGISGSAFGFYGPVTRAWEFLIGSGTYLVVVRKKKYNRFISLIVGTTGLSLLGYGFAFISEATQWPSQWTLIPAVSTAGLLYSTAGNAPFITKLVGIKPLALIGDWSYSIYLWHWPFIVFAQIIFPNVANASTYAAIASLIPAIISYYLVERPIRKSQRRSKIFVFAVIFLSFILPLSVAKTIEFVQTNNLGPYKKFAHQQEILSMSHYVPADICNSRGPWPEGQFDKCWVNKFNSGKPIYLVGDSNAYQFTESVIGASKKLKRPAWIGITTSCPYIENIDLDIQFTSPYFLEKIGSSEFDHCADYVNTTLRFLATQPAGLVVISSLDQYWWDPSIGAALEDNQISANLNAKANVYQSGLINTINQLKAAGHDVLLVQSIPTYRNPLPIWDPTLCTYFQIVSETCKGETSLATIEKMQSSSRQAVSQAATLTGSAILDLRNYFCDDKACSTIRNGKWLYKDAAHLSTEAATDLIPQFTEAIRSAN